MGLVILKKGLAMGLFLFLVLAAMGGMKWVIEQQKQQTEESSVIQQSSSRDETKEESSASQETTSISTSPSVSTSTQEQSEEAIEEKIATMSLEEKVGQLFFVRVPESNQIEELQNYHFGGYLLFGRDTENETAESLKQKISLLIGMDEEGGTVTRISRNPNLTDQRFLSPQQLYAQGGWSAIEEDTAKKAEILKAYGINAGLFPVADVSTDPQSFIYDRTIGMDAQGTSAFVERVVHVLQKHQVGSTLKHFPGYGNNRDSHVAIVTDDRPLSALRETDFLPFAAGIKAGADSILVAHTIVNSIDNTVPASISKPVHELLRNELHFEGVIMTDDLDMAGLSEFIPQNEAALQALQAGNDLVISSTYQEQIPFVVQAVEDGRYLEADLNASVKRVLLWKEALHLL
jgi:beta-N-acetylhexosaminidase